MPHAAMRETAPASSRCGRRAAAHAARSAVTATLLADAGMTGPARPFEGPMGFVHQLLGADPGHIGAGRGARGARGAGEVHDTAASGGRSSTTHRVPSTPRSRSVRTSVPTLTDRVGPRRHVPGCPRDHRGRPREVIPDTRDGRDSLPYVVCAALQDGTVTRRTFDFERVRRPDTQALLADTVVEPDDVFTAGYPAGSRTASPSRRTTARRSPAR